MWAATWALNTLISRGKSTDWMVHMLGQSVGEMCIRDRIEVRADDVQMWAEETEDHQVSLVLYCEKLTPISPARSSNHSQGWRPTQLFQCSSTDSGDVYKRQR